ncbi:acyl-CoA dehydrogenase NM domain-like protein [Apiospora saccharicola]|uniref:Acyl-CoA dehydrogenase NM domain-like protein n=1 Tax=Apiospora saccharicola TaxID=335842 RepID=A0ABR1VAJ4_9PEZI
MSPSKPQQADDGQSKSGAFARTGLNTIDDSDRAQKPPELFGDKFPWAEPAWCNTLASPYYNATHRALRDHARRYIDTHIIPNAPAWEATGECPEAARKAWTATGLSLLDVPLEYRPAGHKTIKTDTMEIPLDQLDAFHLLILNDECSRFQGGVATGLAGANVIGLPPVIHHGTEAQKRRWLPGLFTWETNFCLGITEPSGGSDVGNLRTAATKSEDGSHYVVNGTKKWITGSPWATHMTTAVRTGTPTSGIAGISLLVIPLSSAGITIEKIHNSGQNAGGASWVRLHDVRVPVDHLLGAENAGFKLIMTNFNKERFVLAVSCNRHARTCLSTALAYALERETFGQPLVNHQVIRHKLATLAREVEAHWAWLEQIAYHVDSDPRGWQSESIAGRIALAKVSGGRVLELAAREAQQIMGGVAYQKDGPGGGAKVEQITRDLRMNVVGGGSEEILNDLAFREEMKRAKKIGSHL